MTAKQKRSVRKELVFAKVKCEEINKLSKISSKSIIVTKISHFREVAKHRKKFIDDNSRNMPEKADCVKSIAGEKREFLQIICQHCTRSL